MFTVRELSEHFDVSETTIRNWITSGRMKAKTRKRGMRTFYEVSQAAAIAFARKYDVEICRPFAA